MANFYERYPLNIPGRYYIDSQCTDCDLCRETAPNNVKRDDRTGTSYVFKQPENEEEAKLLEEGGVKCCPTEAVGNNGDRFDWATEPIYNWNEAYRERGIDFGPLPIIVRMEQSSQISLQLKGSLCVVAWIAAIIAMAFVEDWQFSWAGILLPPVFSPAGFPFFMLLAPVVPNSSANIYFAAFVGWSYYVALTTLSLRAKRRVVFSWLFIVLCGSLLLNIAGCASMKNTKFGCEYLPPNQGAAANPAIALS